MHKNRDPENGRREISVAIQQQGDIAEAAEAARELSAELAMDRTTQYMVATAVSELATNIDRYAGHGFIHMTAINAGGRQGIEIRAVDHGPGIADLESALEENVSTSGSLGIGLPGARRLMDEFEIESDAGKGTLVTMRKWR